MTRQEECAIISKEREKRPNYDYGGIIMKIKKIAAAVAAMAVLAVAAPMTGVLPNPLGVTASAEEVSLNVGDLFQAAFDRGTGAPMSDKPQSFEESVGTSDSYYECKILSDNTVCVCIKVMGNQYFGRGESIVIPEKIGGYTVTEIGIDGPGMGGFKSITIPDTVKVINKGAFAKNLFLEEVKFGANSQLELIDQWAFQDCRSLKSITIPASVETIVMGAFFNSSRELTANVSDPPIDFTNTYSLTSVKFEKGSKLKTVGELAFRCQKALTSIELPDGLETIGNAAFLKCPALTSVTLPDSLETIGESAFMGCPALTSVTLPASVETIGNYAFNPDSEFPDSALTAINVDAANPNFKSVDGVVYTKDGKILVAYPAAKKGAFVIPDGVTSIQQGAFQCAQISSLTVPEGVTEISVTAFCLCPNLESVTLPESLTKIDKMAFQGPNKLTSVTIPASVTSIDPQAFENSALTNINGAAGSYAETFAKKNGYTFNSASADTSDSTSDSTSDTTSDSTSDSTNTGDKNPNTGAAGVSAALGAAALAGAAVIASRRKRR